jgi:hypothetical protein
MELLKGKLIEKSKANTFFIEVQYYGGDGATYENEQLFIDGVNALNYLEPENQTKIFEKINFLELIKDIHGIEFNYDEIKSEYGSVVANFIDNIPGDPECDYQYKCSFDCFELRYYDSESNLFSVYYKK